MKVPEYVVAASNVPIGLYEAVFDTDGGKKYLKGWRYVGFSALGGGSPIGVDQSCARGPNSPGWGGPDGSAPGCPAPGASSSIPGPLYGLVFFNGVMTFRQLDEIANNMTCPQYLKPIPEPVGPVVQPPVPPIITPGGQPGGVPQTKPPETKPEAPRTPEGATSPTRPGLPSPNPSTSPTPPGPPSPNPSTSSTGGGKARSASSPGDEKVTRTSDKIKIPPPRVGDLTK